MIPQGMKCDRKRLKGEKLDLLGQIKQLYTTLEDKETELRDFIKNYESRVKESDEMIKQVYFPWFLFCLFSACVCACVCA